MSFDSQSSSPSSPPTAKRTMLWWVLLALFAIWPALTNGQPFFYMDTTAYVRGADVAISKVFGAEFATDWAKDPRRTIGPQSAVAVSDTGAGEQKPARRFVSAGRSIVYGMLLYLGEVFRDMWFCVIIQSLLAVYLIFVLTVKALGLDFRCFLLTCAALFLFSSLPFFISFLMPDVFSGFLILGTAILATSWDRLTFFDRAAIGAILSFAVLAHTSHLALLVGMTALVIAYVVLLDRSQWKHVKGLTAIVVTCVAIFALWDAVFSFSVSRALGMPPVRPPFLMGKLVSKLDQPALAKVCASNNFVVCRYQDRLPVDDEWFIWSDDERRGIYGTADLPTKQAMFAEQFRFTLAVVPPNLGRFASTISQDVLQQLTHIGLDEFSYPQDNFPFFQERMPSGEFSKLTSTVAARSQVYVVFGRTVLYGAAVLSATLVALLLGGALRPAAAGDSNELAPWKTWRAVSGILLAGVVLNAIICGGLSHVHDRYEARVAWLIPLSLVTGIQVMKSHRSVASLFERSPRKEIAVSDLVHEERI
jgi:hypothetical protein